MLHDDNPCMKKKVTKNNNSRGSSSSGSGGIWSTNSSEPVNNYGINIGVRPFLFINTGGGGRRSASIGVGVGIFTFPPLGNVNRNKSASPDTIRCPDGRIVTVLLTDEECPNKRVNGVCVEDDKIINKLTGKAKCVYEKMVDSKGNINWILNNFKDGDTPSEFDLKFVMATDLPNSINGRTLPANNNNRIVIKINANTLSNRTSLEVARTILHEGIHARLEEFAKRKGSNATDFPGIYDYYWRNNKNTWSHQQMAAHYISTIAKGLKQYDNAQHSYQYYNDLAWNGLYKISNGANNPPIFTDAWNTLTQSEKTRIKNTIISEHTNGNKNCN